METHVGNRMCQLAVRHHAFHVQILDADRVEPVREICGELVLCIPTDVADTGVRPVQRRLGIPAIGRAVSLAAQAAGQAPQALEQRASAAWGPGMQGLPVESIEPLGSDACWLIQRTGPQPPSGIRDGLALRFADSRLWLIGFRRPRLAQVAPTSFEQYNRGQETSRNPP